MNEFDLHGAGPRLWRHDEGAMLAGVCAGLAEDLDLPLPLIRLIALVFLVLPTGLAYLALGLLLRRRPGTASSAAWRARAGRFDPQPFETQRPAAGAQARRDPPHPARAASMPPGQDWALLRHRLAALEPRLERIEGFVTSNDFELHRDFRRMGE